MALVTFILLSTLLAGLRGEFQPELLASTATKGLVVVVVEIFALKLGCYLLSISSQSQLFDLIAYSGYKFVGIIITIAIAEIVNGGKGTGGLVGWGVFLYTFLANSLFLVRIRSARCIDYLVLFTLLTAAADAIPQVRPATRNQQQHRRPHADGFPSEAQPENPILVLLLVHCPVLFHVDLDQSLDGHAGDRAGKWRPDGEQMGTNCIMKLSVRDPKLI